MSKKGCNGKEIWNLKCNTLIVLKIRLSFSFSRPASIQFSFYSIMYEYLCYEIKKYRKKLSYFCIYFVTTKNVAKLMKVK